METIEQITRSDLMNSKMFNFEITSDTMLEKGHDPMHLTKYAKPTIPKDPK